MQYLGISYPYLQIAKLSHILSSIGYLYAGFLVLDKALLYFKAIESCGLISIDLSNAVIASSGFCNTTRSSPIFSKLLNSAD